MNLIFKKIWVRLRASFFPTEKDRNVNRWMKDSGEEKLRYEFDLTERSLVMDLGGYEGQWASDIYARYKCRILLFEPVKTFADKIKQRFSRNPNIEVFDIALGNADRQETIYLDKNGSSVFKNSGEKELILFMDVASFFNEAKIDSVDLMKINIEGGEYELLERMISAGIIKKVKQLQIQFHEIDKDSFSRMENIKQQLRQTHAPTFAYKFIWENWILK